MSGTRIKYWDTLSLSLVLLVRISFTQKGDIVTNSRNYSRADRAALTLLSGGTCYLPDCGEPLLRKVDGKFKLALEIAHIRAAKQGGERYVASMTDEERNSFDNLIFLCTVHHKTIDEPGAARRYPIELLEKWKRDREKGKVDTLRGLRGITEDRLVDLITQAIKDRDRDIKETLERLERIDADAALLMRELLDELNQLRHGTPALDPDIVGLLYSASDILSNLPDYAPMLCEAAGRLEYLGDHTSTLMNAADLLTSLDDKISHLQTIVQAVSEAADKIDAARWS